MHLNLPPLIPYVVGALLVVFGSLRIKVLGAPRPPRPTEQDEQPRDEGMSATPSVESTAVEPADVRGPEQKRHIRWGILWVLMGLFLLISTYIQTHR
jgi:hypothetical protein